MNRETNTLSEAVQVWEWLVVNLQHFMAVERLKNEPIFFVTDPLVHKMDRSVLSLLALK